MKKFNITGRKSEEKQKFARLVRTVIWIQEKSGKSYPEVIKVLFQKRRNELLNITTG